MKPKLPSVVVLLVLTTITIVMWISLSIYRAAIIEPDVKVSEEILTPLDPNLNQQVVTQIESRLFIDPNQVTDIVNIQTPTPIPTVTPEPVSTLEASPTPEASSSAEPETNEEGGL